jgi:hypothetical protein
MRYLVLILIIAISFVLSSESLSQATIEEHTIVSTEIVRENKADRNAAKAARIYGRMMANWSDEYTPHDRPSYNDIVSISVTTSSSLIGTIEYTPPPAPNQPPSEGDTRTTSLTYCSGSLGVQTSTTETFINGQWVVTSSSWSYVQLPQCEIGGH